MTTIKAIAEEAGVSIATVSRALNNHPSVNADTRLAILQVAERLNYPLDTIQNKQRVGRSVLIIVRQDKVSLEKRDLENNIWNGVQVALENTTIATRVQQSKMTLEEAQHYVSDMSISGLVILGGVVNHDFAGYLIDNNMPFVVAGARLHGLSANAVMADVPYGMQQIGEHLIQSGRRHIGFVNGPDDTMTSEEKLNALRYTLFSHQIDFPEAHIVASDFSAESGYLQTQQLIDRVAGLDAIIFADDTIALGGIRALRERGVAIPDDIAVTGFGDYEIARFISPALTTVRFDMRQMGRIAARRLKMLLDEPDDDNWLIRIPTELVIRDSS